MSYADRVKKAKEARNFKFPEGLYKVRYDSYSFEKSKKGNEQFILNFKIKDVPSDAPADTMDKIRAKKKQIKMHFVISVDFAFNNLLEYLEAVGADLASFDDDDATFEDIKAVLAELEDIMPESIVNLTHKEDSLHNNYYFHLKDQVKCLEAKKAPEAPVTEEAPTPPPAPKEEYTRVQLLATGWTDEQITAEYGDIS